MICLVTGTHGMIAPLFIKEIKKEKYKVLKWNRKKVNIDNDETINKYLNAIKPQLIVHFAYGRSTWASLMAKYAKENNIKFVFISTVNVFGDAVGPLHVHTKPIPNDEYSHYKRDCELAILNENPNSYIFRIGWQISPKKEKHPNNMLSFLLREQKKHGYVEANINSYMSCSLTDELAKSLVKIIHTWHPGIFLFNSNKDWNQAKLFHHLNNTYKLGCKIKEINGNPFNNLMVDERVHLEYLA